MYENVQELLRFIGQPWPWYVGGGMIAVVLFILLFLGKEFGISANFRTMCAANGAGDMASFFKFDYQSQAWNLMVALGAVFGGYFAAQALHPEMLSNISPETVETLNSLGLEYEYGKVPLVLKEAYSWEGFFTLRGAIMVLLSGFLVGFGARYAGGCTSGHAISGISNLQWPSLLAVVGFFTGGLIMINFIFPYILKL
ncbi:MAG: YeeE/YedE family protein [Crocinitomicaceae bacterium]|nr:YeeE/YedE family protein [Crocinitomicaceae bacterium]|tara:strand:- start:5637 stop:6230 length:594 start_codon:yes stop_codon:yes gene_type:complete